MRRRISTGFPGVALYLSCDDFYFATVSNDSSSIISFLILVGSVFWMISYVLAACGCADSEKADAEGARGASGFLVGRCFRLLVLRGRVI